MDNLNGIVAFVRTAETLSFVAAGRKLGISASAVGKTIAKLERSLGVRLFHRTTRRVTLTEEGRHFHERCHRILEELRDAEATLSASAQTPRGRLRVSLPVIGYRFLLPVLPAFSARYPDIELDLDFNDRLVDVVEGGFDAVIRSGQLSDSSLMSRRLGPFRFVLCASPDYLARDALAAGSLVEVLEPHSIAPGQFSILWPSSRQLSPKLRVFVDFMCEHLFPAP
ncbi:LysR family transcriptional regulator [Burkholderia gladioli]|uniref:LysR family transcriptional regulator n=1 Tax=Burkholderia gladioli TaxID=28095 RepID=UPI00163F4E83|nr:LysR substrate-binding domain-containing protein [Burkholderia gladioli]